MVNSQKRATLFKRTEQGGHIDGRFKEYTVHVLASITAVVRLADALSLLLEFATAASSDEHNQQCALLVIRNLCFHAANKPIVLANGTSTAASRRSALTSQCSSATPNASSSPAVKANYVAENITSYLLSCLTSANCETQMVASSAILALLFNNQKVRYIFSMLNLCSS